MQRFYMNKKITITVLMIIIFVITVMLHTFLNNGSNDYHFFITVFYAIYIFFLFINMFALKYGLKEKPYKILRIFIPVCNIVLNFIVFQLVFVEYDDRFCSLFLLYGLILSIFFDTEYIESFVFYSLKCILLMLLFTIKYLINF